MVIRTCNKIISNFLACVRSCYILLFSFDRPSKSGWQIGRFQPEPKPDTPDLDLPDGSVGMKRIVHNVVDQALLQSTKREVSFA